MAQFDKYGRWINPNYQSQPISSFASTYQAPTRRRTTVWQRFNDFITNIGNWFAGNSEALSNNLSVVFAYIVGVGFLIGVIATWIRGGFWEALITALIGGIIVFVAAAIVMQILQFILAILFFVLRFLFYNAYVFLLIIGLTVAISLYASTPSIINKPTTPVAEVAATLQPNFYCNATSLNVREKPSANARIIGKLKQNEAVYVYAIDDNNFAKIKFKDGVAYVSANYLVPTF